MKNLLTSPTKIIFFLALFFLGFQAFTGEQGLLQWREYHMESQKLEKEKSSLVQKRAKLQEQLDRLKAQKTDEDLLEEVAISKLKMVKPGDKVINIAQNQPNK